MEYIIDIYSLYLDPLKKFKRQSRLSDNSSESIADHSWSVCVLAMMLGDRLDWGDEVTNKVIRYLLVHDIPEAYGGDIPSTIIAKYPHIKSLKAVIEPLVIETIPNQTIKCTLLNMFDNLEDEDILSKVHLCDKLDWMFQQLSVIGRASIPRFLKEQTDLIIAKTAKEGLDVSRMIDILKEGHNNYIDSNDIKEII